MVVMGPPFAWGCGVMGSDKFMVLIENADCGQASGDPKVLADETKRGGIIGVVEVDVAIAMETDLFPFGGLEGGLGQRLQGGLFHRVEQRQGLFFGSAVIAGAGDPKNPFPNL